MARGETSPAVPGQEALPAHGAARDLALGEALGPQLVDARHQRDQAIALAQSLRVVFRVEVTAGGVNIPLWVSILAVIVLGALGIWLWRERRE